MSPTPRTIVTQAFALLLLPCALAWGAEKAGVTEEAGATARDDAALLQEQAADYEVDVCILWLDAEAGEPFTDEQAIEDCLKSPGQSECEWTLEEDVTLANAAAFEEQGYVIVDADADPQLAAHLDGRIWRVRKLGDACEEAAAWIPGGLSTAAKVGIGVGAAAAGVLLLDDDDDPVASPSSP